MFYVFAADVSIDVLPSGTLTINVKLADDLRPFTIRRDFTNTDVNGLDLDLFFAGPVKWYYDLKVERFVCIKICCLHQLTCIYHY